MGKRLENGAWGDHITVRGLSDMLSVTIKIFATLGSNVITVAPVRGNSKGRVYIG